MYICIHVYMYINVCIYNHSNTNIHQALDIIIINFCEPNIFQYATIHQLFL